MIELASQIFGVFLSLCLIAVLVMIHELGHYFAARSCGIYAKRVSIGFGKVWYEMEDVHSTKWQVRMWLVGGFVDLFGRVSEHEHNIWSRLSVFAKLWVLSAGVMVNFLAAILSFSLYFWTGFVKMDLEIKALSPTSSQDTARSDFRSADRIVGVNGSTVRNWTEVFAKMILANWRQQSTRIMLQRTGMHEIVIIEVPPSAKLSTRDDFFQVLGIVPVHTNAYCTLHSSDHLHIPLTFQVLRINDGLSQEPITQCAMLLNNFSSVKSITLATDEGVEKLTKPIDLGMFRPTLFYTFSDQTHIVQAGGLQGLKMGVEMGVSYLIMQYYAFKSLLTGQSNLDLLSSPVGILQQTKKAIHLGDYKILLQWIGFMNIALVFMNLIPIPALDGGRCLMVITEAITGKPFPRVVSLTMNVFAFLSMMFVVGYVFVQELASLIIKALM